MNADAVGGAFCNTLVMLTMVSMKSVSPSQVTVSRTLTEPPVVGTPGTANVVMADDAVLNVTDRPLGVVGVTTDHAYWKSGLLGVDPEPSNVTTVGTPLVVSGTVVVFCGLMRALGLHAAQAGPPATETKTRRASAHPRRDARCDD